MSEDVGPGLRQDRAAVLSPGLRRRMMTAAAGMTDVISLARGDPDVETPAHIVDAAKRALDEGYTHYVPWNGLPALRAAVARKLAHENDMTVDPASEILVTGGGQEAIFIALQLLAGPGDEVLLPDPHYGSYDAAVALSGASLVLVPTHEDDDFAVAPDALERHVSPRTRVLVLINPSNPSGSVLTRERLQEIAAFVERHDLWVICDEIYEKYLYDDAQHVSFASLPRMRDRTVTLNSLSKSYAMTGWRIGYLAGPARLVDVAGELKYALSICAPAAIQMAAVAALEGPQDHVERIVGMFDERRRHLLDCLDRLGLPYSRPRAGFTVMVDIRQTGLDAVAFCLRLLEEARVQVFPGSMYGPGGEGYARVSFLAPLETIDEACTRIDPVIRAMTSRS